MRIHGLIISIILLSILYGCADSEVLSTYEGVKEVSEPQVPISFTTYVGDTPDESATTRADWNYLVYYKNGENGRYNNIPFEGQQGNDSRRLGHLAYNSYIVGVYGFVHQNDWKDAAATAEADFFTNQPLLHKYKKEGSTNTLYWDYSPKKYWPNNNASGGSNGYSNQTDKVTFISYYPYQGYEDDDLYYRDGEGDKRQTEYVNSGSSFKIGDITYYTFENKTYEYSSKGYDYKDYGDWREPALAEKDLRNIIPPKAKDNSGNPLTGAEAYTFTFQQKEKVTKHIDFMMGINPNCTKPSVTDNVVLNLKHQLCAIRYAVSFNSNRYYDSSASRWVYLEYMPDVVKIEIKSIKLRGLYDKGTIAPVWDSVNEKYDFRWTIDKTIPPVTYTAFYDPEYSNDPKLMYHARWGIKDGYNPATDGLDKKYERKAYLDNNKLADDFYNANNTKGDGLKWLILALPQTVADDTYVDIEYDLTYKYNLDINGDPLPAGQEQNFYYKKCTESFKMPNGTEFKAGKLMQILLTFYWQGISMDAKLTDWPDDEYLDIEGDINIEPEGDE
jgi:hypothetical protein